MSPPSIRFDGVAAFTAFLPFLHWGAKKAGAAYPLPGCLSRRYRFSAKADADVNIEPAADGLFVRPDQG